jgi:hypothetical protein
MQWWHWGRSHQLIEDRVRVLIRDRPYTVHLRPGEGCYVDFETQEIVVDPREADRRGGNALLPLQWFDGTGRDLPVTNLASLEWLVANVGADHEGGHVLFTDVVPERGHLHHVVINILEDQRMEDLVAAHYPPAGVGFLAFARMQAWRCPLPALADLSRVNVTLNACLFWRWANRFPGSFERRYRFHTEDDRRFWEGEIRPLVEESWVVPTTAEVADIALEILRRLGVPEGASSAGYTLLPGDTLRAAAGRHPGDLPLPCGEAAPPHGDRPYRAGESGPLPDPPDMDISGYPHDLWPQPFLDLLHAVGGEANRLLKALATPAPNTKPKAVASGSRFSPSANIRTRGKYPFLSPRARGRSPGGLAGVVLLIDRTGSMGGDPQPIDEATGCPDPESSFYDMDAPMPNARRAAMLLEVACTRKGIPLCIGFAGTDGATYHLPGRLNEEVPFYHATRPVAWLRTWATPRNAEGPKALIAGLYGSGERECVSSSLRQAQQLLDQRGGGTKLILYIHDGRPTDETAEEVQCTLAGLRRKGTIIVGVYVGHKSGFESLQAIFGGEFTILVERLSDLPKRLSRILVKYARS